MKREHWSSLFDSLSPTPGARRLQLEAGETGPYSRDVRSFLISAVFLAGLAACGESAPEPPAGNTALARPGESLPTGRLDRSFGGTPAPTVAFQDPDGKPVTLAQFRGRPVLVNLWATWCAPCIAEMPTLDALAAREPGLKVLTLSQDLDGRDKVNAFFAQRRFTRIEPYLDPEIQFMTELGISTLPTTILYDEKGREVWRMSAMENWTGARAAKLLKERLPPA
jgi:thiol-disulfide isomerase/thioredoxin